MMARECGKNVPHAASVVGQGLPTRLARGINGGKGWRGRGGRKRLPTAVILVLPHVTVFDGGHVRGAPRAA